jgi:hypothetical protein
MVELQTMEMLIICLLTCREYILLLLETIQVANFTTKTLCTFHTNAWSIIGDAYAWLGSDA